MRQRRKLLGTCKIAWDISGDRDESKCIDIDPFNVFHSPVVDEFPEDETEIKQKMEKGIGEPVLFLL